MEEAGKSKKAVQFEEENEDCQVAWEFARIDEDFTKVCALTLLFLSRKLMKRMLYCWAKNIADDFWKVHKQHERGDGVTKEYGGYGVRIIEQGWTVTIQWYHSTGRGKGRKPTIVSMRAPDGKSHRMAISRFARAKDWELVAINEAENEFEKIRRCSEHLKAMIGPYRGLKQIIEEKWMEEKANKLKPK